MKKEVFPLEAALQRLKIRAAFLCNNDVIVYEFWGMMMQMLLSFSWQISSLYFSLSLSSLHLYQLSLYFLLIQNFLSTTIIIEH